ncbi:M48 family metallopeptidase [Desulfobacula sp.]
MNFEPYSFEIVKKTIKHIYFRVYPSKRKIIVSAPLQIDPETLNRAILSKFDWIKAQIKKGEVSEPGPVKTYTTGEELMFKGKGYPLYVNYQDTRPKVFMTDDNRIHLVVNPDSNVLQREKVITAWYRKELKRSIAMHVDNWQPRLGVTINEFNVRKMKTRWGSCNINAKRIWLNLALIKLSPPLLEYVIVHEMVHLLERKHNARFKGFMNQFIPDWRKFKKELGLFCL